MLFVVRAVSKRTQFSVRIPRLESRGDPPVTNCALALVGDCQPEFPGIIGCSEREFVVSENASPFSLRRFHVRRAYDLHSSDACQVGVVDPRLRPSRADPVPLRLGAAKLGSCRVTSGRARGSGKRRPDFVVGDHRPCPFLPSPPPTPFLRVPVSPSPTRTPVEQGACLVKP